MSRPTASPSQALLRRSPLLLAAAAAGTLSAGALAVFLWRRWRARAAAAAVDEHSLPLPSSYSPLLDYSTRDLLVLFPSTREAERQKHYAVMASESLPGASPLLLAPQDAQKKACTYGLDDSEAELLPCLQLLKPRSIAFAHVSLDSFTHLFDGWDSERLARTLILNLCDGTELDGIPGISVLRFLQKTGVKATGADERFFVTSTYKVQMKALFDQRGVRTAPWRLISPEEVKEWAEWRAKEDPAAASQPPTPAAATADRPAHALVPRPSPFSSRFSSGLRAAMDELRLLPYPLLVKPDDSYCSCGITTASVVFEPEAALDYATSISAQFSAVFVEQFVRGREFTVFVAGDARGAAATLPQDLSTVSLQSLLSLGGLRVLSPVERVFDSSLPFWEKFISYELFWEIARNSGGKDEFVFKPVEAEEKVSTDSALTLVSALQSEALRAYVSVGGCGYARVDLRWEPESNQMAVLEVNANCGITQYKQTAMGEILRESGQGFYQLLDGFFNDANKGASTSQAGQ